ncbi:hypothetical protein F5Y01DRAFT_277653 [Xylaria sp. FL0043]|nr:hypothetical protein F5Y01DRAFT_277653 [Xylaria sp. FL0043]
MCISSLPGFKPLAIVISFLTTKLLLIMAAPSGTVPPATYDLIKTWINQQQQAQAPLTDKLRTALLNVENAIKDEPALQPEPDLGDQNWVGLLQEYRAAYPVRGSQEVNYIERPFAPTNRGAARWKCQVTLDDETLTVFPCADESLPSFARKKDAKQYAAKCAVEWLREKGFMPQNGARFPKGFVTPHQQLQSQAQSQQQSPQASGSTPTQGQSSPQTKRSPTKPPSSPFDDSQPSAANQAAELCNAMGLQPPKYDVQPTADGFFRGRVDFGPLADLLRFDTSELVLTEDVMDKKAAKEMLAEKLLKLLQAEKERRDAANQAFLAGTRKGDDGKR